MTNQQPCYYLNIDEFPLVEGWESKVERVDKVFLHLDLHCKLLKPDLHKFFSSVGLIPRAANLWSWEPDYLPPYYHTDDNGFKGEPRITSAVNWLISGPSGKTEWSFKALDHKINMAGRRNPYKTSSQWWGTKEDNPDVSVELIKPMLLNVDIPHRVNTLGTSEWRISYSVRFLGNPSWEESRAKLKTFIL